MPIVTHADYHFEADFVPSTTTAHREVLWNFSRVLVSAGWTAIQHSDGTTVAAGDWANYAAADHASAWIVLRDPGALVEVVAQFGSANTYSSMVYFSPETRFSGGDATTRPTAADEQQLQANSVGGGFQNFAGAGASDAQSYRWQFCAKAEPSERGYYYFHILAQTIATNGALRRVFFVPTRDPRGGDSDTAPWIVRPETGGTLPTQGVTGGAYSSYYKRGLSGEAYRNTLGPRCEDPYQDGTPLGVDPYTGVHGALPLYFADVASGFQQNKGRADDVFVSTVSGFTNMDTTSLDDGRYGVLIDDQYIFPWPEEASPTYTHEIWPPIPAVPDATAPTVTNVSPSAGTELTRDQSVAFSVTDEVLLRRVLVLVSYGTGAYEVAWDGTAFATAYEDSTREAISGGHRYTLSRTSGWPAAPSIRVHAIDTAGNEATS